MFEGVEQAGSLLADSFSHWPVYKSISHSKQSFELTGTEPIDQYRISSLKEFVGGFFWCFLAFVVIGGGGDGGCFYLFSS